MYAAHQFHWFFPFGFLILFFIFFGILFRFRMSRRFGGSCGRGDWRYDDAETIVRRRLANGEIGEEEYQKLREALKH